MFPHSRVNVLLGRQIVAMPAIIVLGLWIVLQLFSGVGTIGYTDETAGQGGIAYMAFAGLLLTSCFAALAVPKRRPEADRGRLIFAMNATMS